ncbi:expressed unknown protein [Seminavis robusta]|uniref:Uncharacterized protein n=1 Tax=Seminavis robusta TaxID=568900 RepID=A0A9N8HK28_9STRA|nr:expressed unknown protein [Seminavis robusta]|eukprot:Sro908_g218832.1  (106) ;mRNA; r:9430-9747
MGYIISLGGCPLVWKSKLLSSVCLATAEAEYYSLSHCPKFHRLRVIHKRDSILRTCNDGRSIAHYGSVQSKSRFLVDFGAAVLHSTSLNDLIDPFWLFHIQGASW